MVALGIMKELVHIGVQMLTYMLYPIGTHLSFKFNFENLLLSQYSQDAELDTGNWYNTFCKHGTTVTMKCIVQAIPFVFDIYSFHFQFHNGSQWVSETLPKIQVIQYQTTDIKGCPHTFLNPNWNHAVTMCICVHVILRFSYYSTH